MIQRIQTVYLFLVIISVIAFDFIPFGIMSNDGTGHSAVLAVKSLWVFIIAGGIIGLLAFITIFLFSNRKLQMKMVLFNILLSVVLIGLFIYELIHHIGLSNYQFGIGTILPIFILLFNGLAYFSIKSDEKLVRSMDRLR